MADKTATFAIKLDSDAGQKSAQEAAALEELRQKIQGSLSAVKELGSAMRSLRGKSDEVTSAKEQLRAMLDTERDKISAANLAILKQGTSYEKLAAAAKTVKPPKTDAKGPEEASRALEGVSAVMKQAGGPIGSVAERFEGLKTAAAGAGGPMAAVVAAIAVVVGAVVELGKKLAETTVELAKFLLEAANARRTFGLLREAVTGTAGDAKNLGRQLDVLAAKVPTPRDKLEELARTVTRSMSGTRASGQAIVDTLNAVAQASAAMGDEVGGKFKEIIERGKMFGRVQINPFELQGTGIRFQDVAAQLAKNLHIGVGQAQQALFQGRVKIDDAAKAIRDAVEKRFGGINLRQMLDLNVLATKFKENVAQLTAGVNLEPFLQDLKDIASLFSTTTVSGAALKQLITLFGNELVRVFGALKPVAIAGIKLLILALIELTIVLLKARNSIRDALKAENFDGARAGADVVRVLSILLEGSAKSAVLLVQALAVLARFGIHTAGALSDVSKTAKDGGFATGAWGLIGENAVKALAEGMTKQKEQVRASAKDVARVARDAVKEELQIHSPSAVMREQGRMTVEGYTQGIDDAAPGAARAVADVTPLAGSGPVAASSASREQPTQIGPFTISVTVMGSSRPDEVRAAVEDSTFMAKLTKAIREIMKQAGVPTNQEPAT